MKDAKKFASTKHKGLPEKKVKKESVEHVGNSDFRSSAEFMNTFAKLKRLRKKNDKIGTGNTGLPQGVAQINRRGKMQGVEAAIVQQQAVVLLLEAPHIQDLTRQTEKLSRKWITKSLLLN